ncbi:MAG TPA: hypothetical protein DCQ98_05485 [Planctomycetaceae bacterium]|nr:hypothetical protein [Planctomycetaceae bacterium]
MIDSRELQARFDETASQRFRANVAVRHGDVGFEQVDQLAAGDQRHRMLGPETPIETRERLGQ